MRVLFLSSPLFLLFLFFFFSGEGNGMITDPLYRSQWHYNPDERFGIHYHIDQFKKIGLDGSGVLISITVDSVAERNRDIAPRLNPSLSKTEWASTLEDRGNSIVSLAVADANQFCSIGIASGAEIGLQEAESDLVSVIESFYFRQWEVFDIFLLGGEVKPTRDLSAPPDGTISILRQVASEGRQGKGGIVVGPIPATRAIDGHCSTDQFLSQREVIAVASVSKDGEVRDAPKCAKYLVTAPTQVVTTVNDNCPSDSFDDPQAPAAIVAGAIALLLQLSPELQWYEVQQVLIESAMGVPGNIPFDTNAAGKRFSYDFGFGFLNVDDALNYLSLYTTAREPFIAELQYSTEGSMHIPEGEGTSPLIIEFEVEESPYPVLNAMLTLDVNHPQPTDLSFSLLSPSGTTVSLLPSGRGVTTFETNRVQFGGTGFYFSITSVFPTGNVEAPLVEIVRTIGNCCKANYKKCKIDDTIQLTTTRVAILMENNEKCNIEKQLTVVEGLPGDLQIEIVIFPYEALPGVAQITKPYPVVSGLTEIGFSSLDTLDFMANSEYDLSVKFNFVATKKGDAWPTPAFYRNLQLSTLYFYGERAPGKWRAVISDDLEYDVGLIKTATLSLTVTSTMRIIPPSPTPSPTPSPSPIPSSSPFPTPSPSPFTPPSPSPSPNPSSSPTPHPSPSPAPTPPAPTPSFSPSPSPFPAPSPSPTPTPTPTPSPSPAPVQEHFCGFYPEYDCNACDHCCTGLSEEECNICVAEFCEEKKKPEKKSNVMVGVVIFGCVALAGTGAVLYYLYPAMVISYSQRAFAFVQSSFERLVEKVREKMGSGGDKRDKKRKRDRERAENEELIEDDIDFDGYSSDDDGEGIGEGRKEKELEKEEESDEEEDEGDSDDDSEDDSDEDSDEEGSKKCLIS